jgi:hypothetical protein
LAVSVRAIVLISSIALGVTAGAQASPARGILTGTVTRGPVTPVCTVKQPCDEPAAHVTLLFIRHGGILGRAVTSAAGRYRLQLPAGTYGVRRTGASGPLDRKLDPNTVRVYAARSHRVDFSIDTGIR